MALVDADYRFIYCDVGSNGRVSDGGVFKGCSFNEAMERRTLNFPEPAPVPGDNTPIPYFVVADEAFPLKENIMKPFSRRNLDVDKQVFNYRLSRARRVVENAFGILSNRFRVFLTTIALQPSTVEKLVLAAICLHNMLRTEAGHGYCGQMLDREDVVSHTQLPGSWRSDPNLERATFAPGTNATNRAKELQQYLCNYVNSREGSVPWQMDQIRAR